MNQLNDNVQANHQMRRTNLHKLQIYSYLRAWGREYVEASFF